MRRYVAAALGLSVMASGLGAAENPRIYDSPKSREVIADCLANRLGGTAKRLRIEKAEGETRVTIRGIIGNIVFDWVVRDAGSGSRTELRKTSPLTVGRKNAETCFV